MASNLVEAFVTREGAHVAPVSYLVDGRLVQPYAIAPWFAEDCTSSPKTLQVLRGDFFCMPFGLQSEPMNGEMHPLHGETSNETWTFEAYREDEAGAELRLSLETKIRPALVERIVGVRHDETALYQTARIREMSGPMTFGTHATLRFRSQGRVSTSAILEGQVFDGDFELPELGGYTSLKPGARFSDLSRVPLASGGEVDLSIYPQRDGFEDIVQLVGDPNLDFAWSAATFPEEGFVWLQLKNPRALTTTILWISNGGRHYAPWNGRHRHVMGIEEVTGYMPTALEGSVQPNPINELGVETCKRFSPEAAFEVSTIHAVAAIDRTFDVVERVEQEEQGALLVARSGAKARTKLIWTSVETFRPAR